jgi:uncharacterized protein
MQFHRQKRPLQSQKPNLVVHKDAAEKKPLAKEELNTEFLVAVLRDDAAKAKNLLDAGADIEAKDEEGKTALIWAANEGYTETCAFLLEKGANVNAKNCNGCTALMYAANEGYAETCALLLEKGAKVDAREDIHCQTALMHAVWIGHARVCELLIMHKARINATDSEGKTVLKIAEQGGDGQTVALLRLLLFLNAKERKAFLPHFRECTS